MKILKRFVVLLVLFVTMAGAAGPVSAAKKHTAYDQRNPTVAYNPHRDEYILIWTEVHDDRGADLYTKLLFTNGLPKGGFAGPSFRITREAGDDVDAAITYNHVRDEYLMVWSAYRDPNNGWDIYGQLVFTSGLPKGRPFEIFIGPGDQTHPAVAFSGHREDFVVVWADDRTEDGGRDLFAQGLFTSGLPRGEAFPVVVALGDQIDPVIAPHGDRFLLLWTENRPEDKDIYGKLLFAAGLPIGGPEGGSWGVATGPGNQEAPALGPTTAVAVWQSDINAAETGLDLFSNLLFPNGLPRGRSSGITRAEANQADPALAYNPRRDEFIVVWTDDRNESEDLYAILVRRNGLPKLWDYAIVRDGCTAVICR
ncbi:MAG: hypothetical protein ACE5LU_23970 [Anaerolineae bacterium]